MADTQRYAPLRDLGVSACKATAIALALCSALQADAPRAYVDGKTVRTAGGDLLRGTSLHVSGFTTNANGYGLDKNNLLILRDQVHLNCIRLNCLDPRAIFDGRPERAMPIAEEAGYCDQIIDNCGDLGMYVILDYHCMMHVWDGGEYDVRNFWRFYAPRYADRTHVLYEIENEPWQHPPDSPGAIYNPSIAPSLEREVELYQIVRNAAPDAVILTGYEVVGCTDNWGPWLKNYAQAAGFSWTSGKDVWPWHDYAGTTVEAVRATWDEGIPMICSEYSYEEDGWYNVSLEGEKYVAEWCEREGMSWVDWKSWGASNQAMQLPWIIPDAEQKGWKWWDLDDTPPPAASNLSATAISEMAVALTWDETVDPDSDIRTYVVYRDGNVVARPATNTYTDEGLSESSTYSYQVSAVNTANLEGAKSPAAGVTTPGDNSAPGLLSVSSNSATGVSVVFNEPVSQASAQNPNNYAIDNGVTVSSASLGSDLATVTLSVSTLTPDVEYTLAVSNIADRAQAANTLAGATQSFRMLRAITRIRYYPRPGHSSRMQQGVFEGSDGSATDGPYTVLHTITAAPPEGQWTEVALNNTAGYRFVRYRAPLSSFGNVAEIEFYRGTEKATGPLFGMEGSWENSGSDYTKAFDGDVATFWDYSSGVSCYAGLDLGDAGARLSRYHGVQAAPGAMSLHGKIVRIPAGEYTLDVIDAAGKQVHRETGVGPARSDLSFVQPGMYLVKLTSIGTATVRRMVGKN